MKRSRIVAGLAVCALAGCGVPTQRTDELTPVAQVAFREAAASSYAGILAGLDARGMLDDDAPLLARTRRVAAGLIGQAARLNPDTAAWAWEVHTSGNAATGAFCLAGGKILVGSAFVRRMALADGELAMLVAHEMAHAVAGHRRSAAGESMESDAAQEVRRIQLAVMQEDEADRIGMRLAYAAGWPPSALADFFDKLAAIEPAGAFSDSHRAASQRAAMARELAKQLAAPAPRD
jgi:predicted Zn-dependent protease